jgi:beta-lactamase regulating signal transducer with metallopeptidase domain
MSFSFLFEMTWKSALIIGAALMLVTLLRSRSAADRAAVLRLSVTLLLMLPVIAMFLPALQVEMAADEAQPLPFEALLAAANPAPVEIAPLQPVPATIWDDPSALIGIAYLGGLLMVAFRIVAGLWTLRRWTAGAQRVAERTWVDALERARPEGAAGARVRLLVSDESPSPLSWGLINPVILLDRDTLERPEDAEAIIAHEMAHIERRDWLTLMMTRISVALFWFNPLVWLLEREIVQQAEEAADTYALGRVEPAFYAQTLVSCAQHAVPLPANSMAPVKGGLGRRISAILDGRTRSRKSGSFWTLAAMLGCTAFAAPLAAVELVPAFAEAVDLQAPVAPVARAAPIAQAAAVAPLAPLVPVAAVAPAPLAPAPLAPPSAKTISVPAIDVDVPAVDVKVPAISVTIDGEHIRIPSTHVVAPRVKVNVPAMRIPVPVVKLAALPPELVATIGGAAALHPHGEWSKEEREELAREMREAQREVRRELQAEREILRAQREARHASHAARNEARLAAREAARAHRHARISMSHGAVGMEKGADGMVRGARQMEEEADKLRSADYRERQIAKAAAEGRTVTHQELIDAIPKLRDGARKMVEGAQRMRESAARMRRQTAMN